MRGPDHCLPAFAIGPGHVLGQQNAKRNSQHGHRRDQRGPKRTPQQEVAAPYGRREHHLVGVATEVAESRKIDKYGRHQQGEHADGCVKGCNREWRIPVNIGEIEFRHDFIGADRAKNQQTNDEEENPQHPGTKPEANFKPRDTPEHNRLLIPRTNFGEENVFQIGRTGSKSPAEGRGTINVEQRTPADEPAGDHLVTLLVTG